MQLPLWSSRTTTVYLGRLGLHPTTPNWEALTDAMWVSQALTSDETMRASFDELKNLGVRHWIKTLRNLHEGKQT